MPVQGPQWSEYLSCPVCKQEFEVRRTVKKQSGNNFCVTGNKEAAGVPGMWTHGVPDMPRLPADAAVPLRQHPHRRLQSRCTSSQHRAPSAHREWGGASQVLGLLEDLIQVCVTYFIHRYRVLPTELQPEEVEPYRLALRLTQLSSMNLSSHTSNFPPPGVWRSWLYS